MVIEPNDDEVDDEPSQAQDNIEVGNVKISQVLACGFK